MCELSMKPDGIFFAQTEFWNFALRNLHDRYVR